MDNFVIIKDQDKKVQDIYKKKMTKMSEDKDSCFKEFKITIDKMINIEINLQDE